MTIQQLYITLDEPSFDTNCFWTEETRRKHDDFHEKYIYTSAFPENKQDDIMLEFEHVCDTDKELAFKIGFKTALELIRSLQ